MKSRFKATAWSLLCGLLGSSTCYAINPVIPLAASCAACHGPQGNSTGVTPTLAALNQDYFIQRMQGFKDGSVPSTVMHHHAKGLTSDEISALASYFATQPRRTPTALPHQTFQGAQ